MVKSAKEEREKEEQVDYKKLITQCGTAIVSHPLTQCRVNISTTAGYGYKVLERVRL